ncbi:succinylglutamate desuccinylase [Halomonas sp. 18H]|uniref:succinylglutamate desuccinylase n=1 Tax=Halomonas almeriensis TaxID=308163 RepID=UPI002231B076|nr:MULTISPECIES: succinylglutamate desuccinylase [Halomonas]MCW4152715.1 succinylglutamate desuccinylase [Halomonas sp. 18H]MDN3552080.1 succinylglutamate desuccinylase [Halomonas almeriensis]
MLAEWLEQSLAGDASMPRDGELAGGRFHMPGPGMLELTPFSDAPEAPAVVLSVGIHGNETAPIELLGASLARLEAGLLTLGSPVLVILGNLEAIRAGTRFVETNLNRLFRRDLAETGMEADRARALMAAVDAFFAHHATRRRLHYDLHTAIRGSQYPRFVVEPHGAAVTTPEQWQWLAGADIQAVLHQHTHSWTFSHYSKHYHAAQAFTLELGRALPFGDNDLAPLAPMGQMLDALLAGDTPRKADASRMTYFRVEHELFRHSEAFRLCFDDDTPNFTEFAPGTCLAEDAQAGAFTVGETPLRVVFPNARVELGARAALLVTATDAPRSGD